MEQKLTILTLGVNDLSVSKHFYEEILGWKPTKFSNNNITFYQLNGFMLSLYPNDELAADAEVTPTQQKGFKGFTLAQNLESEEAVDKLINTLRNKGVTIVKEPQKVSWGGYSSYFSDPDGNLWEIAYNPYL